MLINGPGERSWQLRYDLNLATFGVPGLKFMTRYVTGRGIDGTHAPKAAPTTRSMRTAVSINPCKAAAVATGSDIDLHYVVQSGPAKDLSVQLSHVSHRANTHRPGMTSTGCTRRDRISVKL